MKWVKITSLCAGTFFFYVILASCASSGYLPTPVPTLQVPIGAASVPSPTSSLWPDSLIGKWKGTITVPKGKSQYHLSLEIQRTANGKMIVIQYGGPDIEQGYYTDTYTTAGDFYYCFTHYMVIDGDKENIGFRCFKPINDNQLKYFGEDMDVGESGMLGRVR